MLPRLLAPASGQNEAIVSRVRSILTAAPVPGIVGALSAMRDRADNTSLLPGLAGLPTLVLAGESDQLIPLSDTTRMQDAIPGSLLRVIPNAGHLPPVEQPSVTTHVIQEFLDSLPAETGPGRST
jgi:3-oxoadipate enol-lactonase